jgi:hypothetical protein
MEPESYQLNRAFYRTDNADVRYSNKLGKNDLAFIQLVGGYGNKAK